MGISERKEREKGEMKKMITTAAMKMFLEDGYAKTSIRNIADSIEYSPGTIYLYYKDKDELLYEVQAQAFLQLLETFKTKAISKNPIERLEQLGKAYVSFALENPELYDLMFIIRAPMNVDEDLHKDNGVATFNCLADCLEECMKNGLLIFKDPVQAGLQVWSMMHGLVSLNLRCRLKVMAIEEESIKPVLFKAVEEYLDSIVV
ncbi:DNA-binding transcriptional regulator, AcrR family [Pedobacter steynii]|uniref:DNA-binding transcriptional regulator, AcrR family n=1 Tax=Pedobacter steynii TaxID=430522 RepID=A0A1H0A9M7_9SPHI|nr:TetR/AcrR family transcriptional regulator [Pedobacter steynii]NQX41425.1 TetR/AcrR family transcriptional regulator [Pedobacter steynii]SDN29971.1 DNA-binding transcriptional regulator, AcrR family [Pedobacter steynii]